MLFGLFITLGVAVLSVAMRSYQSSISQKVGAFGILAALVSRHLLHHRQLGARSAQCAKLALSALAGDSHPHPRAPTPA